MSFPTKVQVIKRKASNDSWYIMLPKALAQALDFQKGELVQWTVADKTHLILTRTQVLPNPIRLPKRKTLCSKK